MRSHRLSLRHLGRQGLLAIWLLMATWPQAAHALDAVTLQLKWSHAFQFAGYYAAQEKGYYRDAGLDVTIQEAHPGDDPLHQVLDGKANYGVGNSSLLLARKAGHPVVVLANIFQHSPVVIIARVQGPAQGIHDLVGKRLMLEPQSDELVAYLQQEGIALAGITQVVHSFNPQDLISGKVDAMSAYITNEPYFLDRAGIRYHTYTPRSVGIDFYGDNLFTTQQELDQHPARVKAFREASLRGWEYAMAHPEEIADLILAQYSQAHPREFYLFEAQRMTSLLRTDLIEIGYMNPGRWHHIANTYASLGLMQKDFSLNGFLYRTHEPRDPTWFYVGGLLLALVSAVALYIWRVNRRLAMALAGSKTTQELLRLSEERHRLLADNATDVIWTMNLQGQFTYVSPSVYAMRGYTSAEVMQQSLAEALTPASIPIATQALGASIAAMAQGKPFIGFQGELEQPCKDGSTVWTDVTTSGMTNAAGEFIGILGVSRNITQRKQMEDQVRHLAFHDPLTHLANRRLLNERIGQALVHSRRSGCFGALLFLDLDNFKPLNDVHGHDMGDALLVEVAHRLTACVRETDTVARFGGDEFVVLLTELMADKAESQAQAAHIADKIHAALAQPYTLLAHARGDAADGGIQSGHRHPTNTTSVIHHCTASLGVTLLGHPDTEANDILQRADQAMFQAKAAGRNQTRFAEPASKPAPQQPPASP